MSRLTNFVVLSFSILNNQSDVMSSKGNHTVAIVKGQESYELLHNSCSSIFKSVNKLVERKYFTVDGRDIPIEIYLGGDYKFLLLMLGMKSATSDYACIWCKVHKKDRSDMCKPKDFYWGNLVRTITEVKDHSKRNKFSCQHPPLVDISLENVVLDELHLMLRVTDKLTKNLVSEMIECDKRDNIDKRPMERANNHLNGLIKTVKSCGVSFNVWEKMDANGKGSGLYDFTSLMGSDKKLLLRALPSKLGGVIRPEISSDVVKLWKDFGEVYELVGLQNPTLDQILEYFNKAASWINLFTSLRGKMLGHEKARVIPYMHAMAYHVPRFMERHQGLKKFTGQGVEKLNDDCRRIHLRRSNKWDAPKDVLLVGKRIEGLSDCERVARKYEKQKQSYWNGTIIESRSKRHRLCLEEIVAEGDPATEIDRSTDRNPALKRNPAVERNPIAEKNPVDFDVNCLTCEEIKLKLQEMGVKTRLRCKKKLQELLMQELAMTTLCNKENVQQE